MPTVLKSRSESELTTTIKQVCDAMNKAQLEAERDILMFDLENSAAVTHLLRAIIGQPSAFGRHLAGITADTHTPDTGYVIDATRAGAARLPLQK